MTGLKWTVTGLAVALVSTLFVSSAMAQQTAMKKVLFLTKSEGFQHDMIQRPKDAPEKLGVAEKIFVDFAAKQGYEVTCTKDASLFTPENIAKYDVFAFYTTGDLTKFSKNDGGKGMSPEQKQAMLDAIKAGKGVIGFHSATDMFHRGNGQVDEFIKMMGGEFLTHNSQQKATMKVAFKFPGLEDLKDFEMFDEWYANKNINPSMTVILVQDTTTMKNSKGVREPAYQRPPYPATWALMYGQGRVFYTSMGHVKSTWEHPTFQKIVIAGLDWVSGKTNVELKQNLLEVTPGYNQTTLNGK
ncbi:MAG: ThuA domain-containing protein [Bacillota bacterium]